MLAVLMMGLVVAAAPADERLIGDVTLRTDCVPGQLGQLVVSIDDTSTSRTIRLPRNNLPWSAAGDVLRFGLIEPSTKDVTTFSGYVINDDSSLVRIYPGETLIGRLPISAVVKLSKGAQVDHSLSVKWTRRPPALSSGRVWSPGLM